MPPPVSLRRAAPLAVAAALLGGCSGHAGGGGPGAGSGLPTPSSVGHGRFVATVDLDGGGLTVTPPPRTSPRLTEARASAMFRATDAVQGTFPSSVFGLGVVTISPDVAPAPVPGTGTGTGTPSTTGPPGAPGATTTAATGTTGTTGTTTTSTPGTTTTSTPGTTITSTPVITIPGVVPGASTALPTFDHRLAWVGIVWGQRCPVGDGSTTSTPTTTAAAAPAATRYTAVVLDARTGTDAIAYTSAGPPRCGAPASPPMVSSAAELVSVPWHPVGPASTAVHVGLPACATYYGWTQVPTGATATGVQVVARVPYAQACAAGPVDQVVDGVVPLGNAQSAVAHAALGPVDVARTLSG